MSLLYDRSTQASRFRSVGTRHLRAGRQDAKRHGHHCDSKRVRTRSDPKHDSPLPGPTRWIASLSWSWHERKSANAARIGQRHIADKILDGRVSSYREQIVPDLQRSAAGSVDRILGGAKPADRPVRTPTDSSWRPTQDQALGLTIVPALRARADEVIEQVAPRAGVSPQVPEPRSKFLINPLKAFSIQPAAIIWPGGGLSRRSTTTRRSISPFRNALRNAG